MLKHSIEKNHAEVTVNDFMVIARNYRNNVQKRKVTETWLINQFRPTLNVEEQSFVLKLIYRQIITCSRLTVGLTKETSE